MENIVVKNSEIIKKGNVTSFEIDEYDLLNMEVKDYVEFILRIYAHGKSDLMNLYIKNNIYPIFKEEIDKDKNGETYRFFHDNKGWAGFNIVENIKYSLNRKPKEEPLMKRIIQYYEDNKDKFEGQIAASAVIIAASKDKNNVFGDTLIQSGIDSKLINQVFGTKEDYYGSFDYKKRWKEIRKYILPNDTEPRTLTSNAILKSVLSRSDGKTVMTGLIQFLLDERKKIESRNSIEFKESGSPKSGTR